MSLRVCLYPADRHGCGAYRMCMPAEAAGVDAVVPRDIEDRDERLKVLPMSDVVVFQRPMHPWIADNIRGLQRQGKAVVVDLDDDLEHLDPRHPMFQECHPTRNRVNWQHVRRACELADLVTVSTPALAERYGRGRARVLPNCVPESLLAVEAVRDGRTVGWAGVTATHVDDLTATAGGVAQAIEDAGARFLLVGREASDAKRQLGLHVEPEETGFVPFEDYFARVARFDVGIVPLRGTRFNASKSGLKGLEYAALGVPFVASPLPEYERLHAEGIGLIAERRRDWRREVGRLLADPEFARESAAHARQKVAERHTLEREAWRWAEAWEDAAAIRRGTVKRAA